MKKILSVLLTMMVVITLQVNAQEAARDINLPDTANRTDQNGKKTGYWIEKHGELTFKGYYVSERKVHDWVGYYPNNNIYRVEYYLNGEKEGIAIQFDRKCKISLIEHFRNGLNHGQSTYYSQFNDMVLSETEYAYGKKNGLYRQYYDNGKIQEESMYQDDMKNGRSVWQNKNGQLIAEYNYSNNNFDGLQKTYYENDSIQSINNYKDNKLSGESREYYRNGKMKISGKFLNGQKDGNWTEYDELGKVDMVIRYKEGEEVKRK
ncbi:MAG: toxin-antitoxin system YwqK family antitoxin [Bacteroidales bacterium]|nr:toxin-antitoxin system YwqK family antitoxin [Bacteroidales bacterium]